MDALPRELYSQEWLDGYDTARRSMMELVADVLDKYGAIGSIIAQDIANTLKEKEAAPLSENIN